MEEWDVCLSERLQPNVRARIIRCKAQMEWFDFFSALHLGEHLYCHTDNLSKDLQGTKMAAVSGQRLAILTKGTLTKIRIDKSFDHFYANVACKSEGLLGKPMLPRKQCTLARLEVGARALSYPQLHFSQKAMTDFPTLSYTSTSEFRSLSHTRSLKKVPLSGRASLYRPLSGITREFPCQGNTCLLHC